MLASCAAPAAAPTTATSTAATAPETTPGSSASPTTSSPPTTDRVDTGDVSGFPVSRIRLGGETWTVAVADDVDARGRGLMGVEDLGDLDGMIFVWEDAEPRSFYMLDTLIPLDVAFFDATGVLTQVVGMTPCTEDPCPTYPSSGPVRWAIEAVPGSFEDHPPGTRLDPP